MAGFENDGTVLDGAAIVTHRAGRALSTPFRTPPADCGGTPGRPFGVIIAAIRTDFR
ncbi:hypothetical protein [Pseudonocardia hydrocarbonoxydans]|uniref:hypothetical protein n=1 Tax=Pseudonocardia hydrocarbonoxydans TaxID=76726 RepID=UPI001476BB7B|nr:hypothetical protein [Pseudonocardia hydrocarbonoxydans]